MIYFIAAGTGFVKIGFSKNNIDHRLFSLQTACPLKLKLIKTVGGGYKEEMEIHKRFKKYHVRREWFELNEEIYKFIESLKSINYTPKNKIVEKLKNISKKTKIGINVIKIKKRMKKKGFNQNDLAKATGYTRQHISFILQDSHCSLETLSRISLAVGSPVEEFLI